MENENRELSYSEIHLKELTDKKKADIEARKIVGQILSCVSTQFLSSALALIMFQFSINMLLISLMHWIIVFAPVIPEGGNISINFENGFKITGIRKPGLLIFKLGTGSVMTFISLNRMTELENKTQAEIKASLNEIKQYETPPKANNVNPYFFGGLGFIGLLIVVSSAVMHFTGGGKD